MISITEGQMVIVAILAASSSIIVALIAFFGGRGSVAAQLQGQLNESFKNLTADLQDERVTLRKAWADERQLRLELESRLAGLEQHVRSLENVLRREGISVPPRRLVEPIVMLDANLKDTLHG